MAKKWMILISWLLVTVMVSGQVTLSLQVTPVGIVQKTQLWNMVLVNTGNDPVNIYVSLSLQNAANNQVLLTAYTKSMSLTKGAKQLMYQDLTPVRYTYLSPVFNIDRSNDGFLPLGTYRACYTVYKVDGDLVVPMAEDCVPVEVQPLAPPMLNSPEDTSTIESIYPQFSWLPASPINLFSNLSYKLIVVEVLQGQTKADAIMRNIPVYNNSAIKYPFESYPPAYRGLDTGKVYAWKVIANNEAEPVAQSEIWTFKVEKPTPQIIISLPGVYNLLQENMNAIYVIPSDTLLVKYASYDPPKTRSVTFTDPEGRTVSTVSKKIYTGDNYLDFPLNGSFSSDKVYTLSILDAKNKKHILKFRITNHQ